MMFLCSLADSIGEVGWISSLVLMLIFTPRKQPRLSRYSWDANVHVNDSFGAFIEDFDLLNSLRENFPANLTLRWKKHIFTTLERSK